MLKLIVAAVLIVICVGGARLLIPKLGTSRAEGLALIEGNVQLADCPASPNCAGSQSSRTDQRVDPLMLPEHMHPISTIASYLEAEPRANIVSMDAHYLHATFSTRLMGYVDDVEFLHTAGSDVIHVRSASRLGQSDFGANRQRIQMLRQALSRNDA